MLLSLLACEEPPPPPPPRISDVMRPVLAINSFAEPGEPERLQVFLHPEQEGPKLCIVDISATVNGAPLKRETGLAKDPATEIELDRDCKVYEFTGEPPAGGDARVEITDGVVTVAATVPALFAARATPRVGEGPVKTGDTVTLAWNTPTDTWSAAATFAVELKPVGSDEREVVKAAAAEGKITFTVPDVPAGDYDATFMGTAHVQPTVAACERVVKCDVSRRYVVPPVRLTVR
ncbi:MAG: hypothetical protein ACOZNI_00325 [Myxococcota bacterium]